VPNYFQVHLDHFPGDQWLTCIVIEQRADGLFKVIANMPNARHGGFHSTEVPAVRAVNLRTLHDQQPIVVPQGSLVLQVPKGNPLDVSLFVQHHGADSAVQSTDKITHFFARHSPAPAKGLTASSQQRLKFTVSQDRKMVSCDKGYNYIRHFLSGEVRCIDRKTTKNFKKAWTVQIGPDARHIVEVEKKHATSKIVTLSVDGEILCEALAEDIESEDGKWECNFRLCGERFLEWEVYQTNADGMTLETTGEVLQRSVFSHDCFVSFEQNIAEATLTIGGLEYANMPERQELHQEEALRWIAEALKGSFGLRIPYQIDETAPVGLEAVVLSGVTSFQKGSGSLFGGLFNFCCAHTGREGEVVSDVVVEENA